MSLYSDAMEILSKEPIRNYCVMELMRQSAAHEIFIDGESLLIRLLDSDEGFTMLSSPEGCGSLKLTHKLSDIDRYIYHTGDFPGDALIRGKKIKHFSDCVQYYLPDDVEIDEEISGVVTLKPEMAGYIHEHYDYKHIMPVKYIEDRIKAGPAFGIMADGKLAGWAMTHEEGTMGVLQVLPEYRRRGYATRIDCALIKALRMMGRPCVSHIVKGNTASLEASKKMGFIYSCDVQWIILE